VDDAVQQLDTARTNALNALNCSSGRDRWPCVPSRDGQAVKAEHEDLLRKLALNEEGVLTSLLGTELVDGEPGLDAKTAALVRLAGLVAVGSAPASYQWCVTSALAAGASDAEVVAVLAALAPIVGSVRVNSAAPEVALAIGCELDLYDG
jgi:4-carboxymuconolactone decarboxylase